jgi:hypothetical protein
MFDGMFDFVPESERAKIRGADAMRIFNLKIGSRGYAGRAEQDSVSGILLPSGIQPGIPVKIQCP